MPAEGHARQLLLSASAPWPVNIRSLWGKSTLRDLSWGGLAARAANGASTAPVMSANDSMFRRMVDSPQPATTGVASMTLRMNPAGFQLAMSGCVTLLVLVQRTISEWSPFDGTVIRVSHRRKLYLPSSWPSSAAC